MQGQITNLPHLIRKVLVRIESINISKEKMAGKFLTNETCFRKNGKNISIFRLNDF